MMRSLLCHLIAAVCLAGVAFLLHGSIRHDLKRTEKCDTTYIHPRYELESGVAFDGGAAYSLSRYREVPSPWVPVEVTGRRGRAAVLFVHGHLGSREQMRSMASETAKEISRRLKDQKQVDGVDWFAADFLEEPSGLEPRLLERQAAYVASCLEHLSSSYDKVVLLGYSLGGLVVDRVLDGSSGSPGSSVQDRVAMAITIGSPHFHLHTLLFPNRRNKSTTGHRVPTVRVFSGPGDLLVPSISAWSVHARAVESHDLALPSPIEVDLENVPGIWGTASHKGLVSCNQLVRRIVAMILDGVHLVSPADIQRLIDERMTSDVHVGMTELVEGIHIHDVDGVPAPPRKTCMTLQDSVHSLDLSTAGRGTKPCLIKHLNRDQDDMVQIALHGLKPGKDVWVIAMDGDRPVGDLSHALSPLPPMAIDEPTGYRLWTDIIEGVDWMQNSTWFVELSSGAVRRHGGSSLMLVLSAAAARSDLQVAPGVGLSISFVSVRDRRCMTPGCIFNGTSVISIDVPSVLAGPMGLLKRFLPLSGWKDLVQLMPMKFVVQASGCDRGTPHASLQCHLPVVVSKKESSRGQLDSDQIRTGSADVLLWHPSLLSNIVYVVVDPKCSYTVALRTDILPAMTYAVRYHVFALPGILLALTILRTVPVDIDAYGRWTASCPKMCSCVFMVALVATCGSVVARALNAWQAGSVPWLFLQTPLSTAAITWIAICLDFLLKSFACGCINLIVRVICPLSKRLPDVFGPTSRGRRWIVLVVLAGCLVHDFASFFVAFLAMYTFSVSRSNVDRYIGGYSVVEWGFVLAAGVSPMVIAMSGGKIISYPHRELYGFLSPERLLVSLVSLGSVGGNGSAVSPPARTSVASMVTVGCAAAATLLSLYGYCFGGPVVSLLLVGMNQF